MKRSARITPKRQSLPYIMDPGGLRIFGRKCYDINRNSITSSHGKSKQLIGYLDTEVMDLEDNVPLTEHSLVSGGDNTHNLQVELESGAELCF